jgi:hypothetical protein
MLSCNEIIATCKLMMNYKLVGTGKKAVNYLFGRIAVNLSKLQV